MANGRKILEKNIKSNNREAKLFLFSKSTLFRQCTFPGKHKYCECMSTLDLSKLTASQGLALHSWVYIYAVQFGPSELLKKQRLYKVGRRWKGGEWIWNELGEEWSWKWSQYRVWNFQEINKILYFKSKLLVKT